MERSESFSIEGILAYSAPGYKIKNLAPLGVQVVPNSDARAVEVWT
jgi:hypothetical protein